jgi:hypothetical protein
MSTSVGGTVPVNIGSSLVVPASMLFSCFTACMLYTSSKSSKRIRSTGEGISSGGQSKKSMERKQKRNCELCGKLISCNTFINGKHLLSACIKYAVANGTGSRSSDTAIIMPVTNDNL